MSLDNHKKLDLLQGTLWTDCIREPLNTFLQETSLETLKRQTFVRLSEGESYKLNSKQTNRFPDILMGVGTYGWKYDPNVITKAIEVGCKYIDTAPTYGYGQVEFKLGELVGAVDPDGEVLIGTKIPKHFMAVYNVNNSFYRSRRKLWNPIHLQLHWPNAKYNFDEAIKAMADLISPALLLNRGIISLGLCNCSTDLVQRALAITTRIDTVQIPVSPFRPDSLYYLVPWCKTQKIKILAYSPLGQNLKKELREKDPGGFLQDLAGKNNCTVAQLILRWLMDWGVIPIPRSNNPAHVAENFEAQQLQLRYGDHKDISRWSDNFLYNKDKFVNL